MPIEITSLPNLSFPYYSMVLFVDVAYTQNFELDFVYFVDSTVQGKS